MKSPPPRMLCLGHDPFLQWTRTTLLTRHYDTVSASSMEQMQQLPLTPGFTVILLCYTLTDEEILSAFEIARRNWPQAKILSLMAPHRLGPDIAVDLCLSSLSGPVALLDAMEILCGSAAEAGPDASSPHV